MYSPPPPQQPPSRPRTNYAPWLIGGCVLIVLCLACFGAIGLTGTVLVARQVATNIGATSTALAFVPSVTPSPTATATAVPATPT
ncbi:MAG: hypothetical protein WAM60_04380, partial [Candidatus Promineifilaceae bacterium]